MYLVNNFMHFPAETSPLDMSCVCECSILEMPVLKIRCPGVAIKMHGYIAPDLRAMLVRMTS